MSEAQSKALESKRSYRRGLVVDLDSPQPPASMTAVRVRDYEDYPPGRFVALDHIRLQWVDARFFALIPKRVGPFGFVRSSEQEIRPRHMFTDGGSIPRLLQPLPDLAPWTYGPAYLIHDWLFDLHHCGDTRYGFEEVRDILMEAVKTLMEAGQAPKSRFAFTDIFLGVDSPIARQIWNKAGGCPLPPDTEE